VPWSISTLPGQDASSWQGQGRIILPGTICMHAWMLERINEQGPLDSESSAPTIRLPGIFGMGYALVCGIVHVIIGSTIHRVPKMSINHNLESHLVSIL